MGIGYNKIEEKHKSLNNSKKGILHTAVAAGSVLLLKSAGVDCIEEIIKQEYVSAVIDGGFASLFGFMTYQNAKIAYTYFTSKKAGSN